MKMTENQWREFIELQTEIAKSVGAVKTGRYTGYVQLICACEHESTEDLVKTAEIALRFFK